MGIMCSNVKESSIVTFDIGIDRRGDAIYRVACWNGKQWSYAYYKSFRAARKTYKLLSRII